jgi:hypothetical protein
VRRLNEMSTASPSVENGRIRMTVRSAIRSPWEIVVRAASNAARRLVTERWLVDLLVLALAALMVGASVFYGLAVVSTSPPSLHQPTTGRLTCGVQEVGPGALDACHDRLCCEETR